MNLCQRMHIDKIVVDPFRMCGHELLIYANLEGIERTTFCSNRVLLQHIRYMCGLVTFECNFAVIVTLQEFHATNAYGLNHVYVETPFDRFKSN